MNRKLLSKAVGNINDSFIAEAYRPENDDIVGSPERIVHMKPKRLFTLALAATLILSLGIAAYAVWSIHTARQQEIRSDLKIDENNAESYVEYSVADAQPHGIALLSAINDGEEQRIYLNVSPVAEEDLAGFPGLTRFYCTIEGTEFGGFAAPALPAELSLAGEKNIHTAVLEYAYDRDSQTLTLQCYIMADMLEKAVAELGTDALPLQVHMAVGEKEPICFGTVTFSPTEKQIREFDFNHFCYYDEEYKKDIEILGLVLTPFSAVWKVSYPEAAEFHTPGADWDNYKEWAYLEDKVCTDSLLCFSDGSTFSTGGALAVPYQDGIVNLHCGWGSAIDINDVQSIVLGDLVLWENR